MDGMQTGVGNIFGLANNLFGMIKQSGSTLGLQNFSISDVALATAAVGAALASGNGNEGVDLLKLSLDIKTLKGLGIDTTFLEDQGLTEISLQSLGVTPDLLTQFGVTTTTVTLDSVGINATAVQTTTTPALFQAQPQYPWSRVGWPFGAGRVAVTSGRCLPEPSGRTALECACGRCIGSLHWPASTPLPRQSDCR